MSTIENAVASLADLHEAIAGDEELGAHLILYAAPSLQRKDPNESWKRVVLNNDLSKNLVSGLTESISDLVSRSTDGDISEFDFDVMADGHIGFYPLAEGDHLVDWLEKTPGPEWPKHFSGSEEYLSKTRYITTILSFSDGRQARLFRGRKGLDVVLGKPGRLSATFKTGKDEMIAVDGPIISIDQKVDFLEWDGKVYITSLGAFEAITNIRDITRTKAISAIDALASRFNLPEVEKVKTSIGSKTLLSKKLASAVKHGLIDDLKGDTIQTRIHKKGLDLEYESDGESHKFNFDPENPGQVRQFVELITDVYLHSPTTGREWNVLVKKPG